MTLDPRLIRALGLSLVVVVLAPGESLLREADHGIRGAIMLDWAQAHRSVLIWGTLGLETLGLLLGRVPGDGALRPLLARIGRALVAPSTAVWAALMGGVAFILALAVQRGVYRGLLTNPDEMVSLVHARYFAAGLPGGELPADPAFWLTINAVDSAVGWVSQYPPGHLWVLAAGVLAGAPLLVGPVCSGLGVTLYALGFHRLLPDRPVAARLASLLLALSPFVAIIGGQILSHSTTFVAGGAALYASLRCRDAIGWRAAAWAVAAGVGGALMVAARPWTGLTVGPVLVVGPWVGLIGARAMATRALWVGVGGMPLGLAFLRYHRLAFGSGTTLGYTVAFGPSHGLGFHDDPWGYLYSARAAVGYTSGDLALVGVQLLESPLSPLLLAGLWLLLRPARFDRTVGFLLAWALVSIPANLLYWFHAPRMYLESAPAWLLLGVLAGLDLAGSREDGDAVAAGETRTAGAAWTRGAVTWTLVLALAAPALFVGQRLSSLTWEEPTRARVAQHPDLPEAPSLVFVHTGWSNRIGRVLEAEGMRGDSTGILIGLRDPCELWEYALARREAQISGGPTPPPLPAGPPGTAAGGDEASVPQTAECQRQLRSDRFETVALLPLIWQGDLPGLEPDGAMYVRDLGPEANGALLDLYPERIPLLLRGNGPRRPPVLEAYDEGMRLLWGDSRP
jgi:4-amino-4-deoxy-L-arabinose transferase-like glycosyltransferase